MQFWISEQARLYALILLCALLWTLETVVPLYRYGRERLPHALPNVVLALLLVATNLALSAGSARLAAFTERSGIGLFTVLGMPPMMKLILHKTHHSRLRKETDSNYSNIFSFWDRLGRTYTPRVNFKELRYGLKGFDAADKQTLKSLLKMPFARV
jgi:hypothetical protein